MSDESPTPARPSLLVLAGFFMGVYSTLCGIGGGIFAVPLLHYAYRMPMRRAVANSLGLVAASTASATILEALHAESALRWDIVGALVVGSLVGSWIGFALARRVPARGLKAVFAVLLVVIAIQMIMGPDASSKFVVGSVPVEWSGSTFAITVAIGFVAGIVAPLLGIGGGLVAVPALLHLAPGLGFLVARACSMAMSTVNSWQSVWLYRRDGEMRGPFAIRLAIGAVVGAAVGVQLVHIEAVTRSARVLVAFALVFAAARFAWDLWPRSRVASS